MDEIFKDSRFAHIPKDPAFKRLPKSERKVIIDRRFQRMFSDKKFLVKYAVDKRGRPQSNSSTENLRQYYALDSSSDSNETSDEEDAEHSTGKSNNSLLQAKKKEDLKVRSAITKGLVKGSKKSNEKDVSKLGNKMHDDSFGKGKADRQRMSSSENDSEDEDSDNRSEKEGNDNLDCGAETLHKRIRKRLQDLNVDYARGDGLLVSDSSSEEESSEDEEDEDDTWRELGQDAERTDESTRRLALCNMDWDRIRASDLMVLLNSFLPKGGVIHSVTIYPSEYGLKRMKEEEEKGPLELLGGNNKVLKDDNLDDELEKKRNSKDNEDLEGDNFHREKLRQYQLNRLRYCYAVVVCDSVSTADVLYRECDGMEYESSASRLDLRFIPDDTTFDEAHRDLCTELPNMTKYEPQLFITTALQQSKVRLTWDETDPQRVKFNEKINSSKVDDVDDNDLKAYLATSSDDDEDESDKQEMEKKSSASKYRSLLQSIESAEDDKRQKDMELEVTWGIDLKKKVDQKMKDGKAEGLTPFQKYLQKRKEKQKAKRQEMMKKKKEQQGEAGEEQVGFDSEDEVPSDVDLNDTYFKEEFQKEEFAHTKKSDSKKKKSKKMHVDEESEGDDTKRKKAELELLLMDDDDDNRKHFNLKDILVEDHKNKKKMKKAEKVKEENVDDFEINVTDERFSALYTSHHYNIDPADPRYKKTKGMEALRLEKLSRNEIKEEVPSKMLKLDSSQKRKNAELSSLIKNVKRKTQILNK